MITRRNVLSAGAVCLLLAHTPTRGQLSSVRRVGWLSLGAKATVAHLYAAFRQGMQDVGWLEGKNVDYRFVYADGVVERVERITRDLIEQNVDVIIVGNTVTTGAAQRATKTTPIVLPAGWSVIRLTWRQPSVTRRRTSLRS